MHLVCEGVGPQPAPDAGVPIDLVGLGVIGVDERAQLIDAALEILALQWPYRYLRCSGRDSLPILVTLGARLLPGSAVYARVRETECKGGTP